jgi:hypothetical protein
VGLFDKLFGGSARADPPGTTYFVDHGGSTADRFQVKRVLPGQTNGDQDLKVLESFDDYMSAADYCDHAAAGTLNEFRYRRPRSLTATYAK